MKGWRWGKEGDALGIERRDRMQAEYFRERDSEYMRGGKRERIGGGRCVRRIYAYPGTAREEVEEQVVRIERRDRTPAECFRESYQEYMRGRKTEITGKRRIYAYSSPTPRIPT